MYVITILRENVFIVRVAQIEQCCQKHGVPHHLA